MPREIEFRAWLKNKEEMAGVTTIDFKNGYVLIDKPYFPKIPEYYGTAVLFSQIELMQYVGFRDKNGVKIFEGDIVRVYKEKSDSWDSWFEPTDKYKVINFKDGCFRFGCIEFDKYHMCQYELEVIGNIYENKELLENE